MRPIRVLHLTSTPRGVGGVERLLLEMAPHYDKRHVDVRHCNLFDEADGAGLFPTALRSTGLPVLEVEGGRWYQLPKIVSSLRRLVRREKIDILHLHMLHATIIGGLVGRLPGGPRAVVTKHYSYGGIRKRFLRAWDRFITNRSDAVVSVSDYIARDLVAHGSEPWRTRVIHNGIDLNAAQRLSHQTGSRLADGTGLLLGCVGNLHPEKGHAHLVSAMPRILDEFPDTQLMIVGEGSERGRLQELVTSLGLDGYVTFAGYRADVPELLQRMDVYVQPSLHESFGIVLLEAMAAGLPIVASKIEGIPEVVANGETGYLVPAGDPESLASAVRALLRDDDLRKKMGEAGRKRVASEFDIKDTVRSYEQLYEELCP